MELMIQHLGNGLWLSLMLSMPAIFLAAGIGLVVGIIQAVTQVQEQTISAAPKILGVFMLIIFSGGLMMNLLTDYLRESVYVAFNAIPREDVHLLPPKPLTDGQRRVHMFFKDRDSFFNPGRAKAFLEQPSNSGGKAESDVHITDRSVQYKPSPGAGEKMILQQQSQR